MTVYESTYPPVDISKARRSVYEHVFDAPWSDDTKAFIDVLDPSRYLTRGQLKDLTLKLAYGLRNTLTKLGGVSLQRGDIVMIFSPNSIEYPLALHGSVAAGLRITLANNGYTTHEVVYQLKDSRAKLIFVDPSLLDNALEALKSLGLSDAEARKRIVLLALPDRPTGKEGNAIKLTDLIGDKKAQPERFDGDASNETVFICYSSGTTGLAKGVETTHYNVNALSYMVRPVIEITEKDLVLGFLPFYHIYGLVQLMNYGLLRGPPTVVMPKFALDVFLGSIQSLKITFVYVVPPILVLLSTHPLVDKFDLSSVRILLSGAAPLGADLATRAEKRLRSKGGKVSIIQGYGLTETSPTTHLMRTTDEKPGSVGRLVPNLQARLVGEDDEKDVKVGQSGELWIKGPSVMKGYLHNPKATAASITPDGWFKTGDVAIVDKDGFFWIVDRKKELIKYKGYQVPPAELESLLLSHPKVEDAAVIGIRSEAEATELPRGYIVPAGGLKGLDERGQRALAKEVQEWVKKKVTNHKQLRGGVVCIDAIPKSASGKILRRLLRDMAEKEGETPARAKL